MEDSEKGGDYFSQTPLKISSPFDFFKNPQKISVLDIPDNFICAGPGSKVISTEIFFLNLIKILEVQEKKLQEKRDCSSFEKNKIILFSDLKKTLLDCNSSEELQSKLNLFYFENNDFLKDHPYMLPILIPHDSCFGPSFSFIERQNLSEINQKLQKKYNQSICGGDENNPIKTFLQNKNALSGKELKNFSKVLFDFGDNIF
jgi:hypothetical protein